LTNRPPEREEGGAGYFVPEDMKEDSEDELTEAVEDEEDEDEEIHVT